NNISPTPTAPCTHSACGEGPMNGLTSRPSPTPASRYAAANGVAMISVQNAAATVATRNPAGSGTPSARPSDANTATSTAIATGSPTGPNHRPTIDRSCGQGVEPEEVGAVLTRESTETGASPEPPHDAPAHRPVRSRR